MSEVAFVKMHGLGNDFVVLDARRQPLALANGQVRAIADRRAGVGCDQLIVIEPPVSTGADAFMRIFNADGGEVDACGNATRCIAAMLMREAGAEAVAIDTGAGRLHCRFAGNGLVSVDMGEVRRDWREIPLSGPADTLHLALTLGPLADPVAVNVGNPHCVFVVPNAEAVPLDVLGPQIEHHPLFPQRTNVEVAQVLDAQTVRMRVWERGAGITRACGTGACAAAAATHARGLTGPQVDVRLDGGVLHIEIDERGHALMTGPAAVSFSGRLDPALLAL